MQKFARILSGLVIIIGSLVVILTAFLVGYIKGYSFGKTNQQAMDQKSLAQVVSATTRPAATPIPSSLSKTIVVYVTPQPTPSWGGPQLWDAVNKRRIELGVNPLQVKEEVCTIASIRLNQLLALGKLDAHAGFANMPQDRPDLKWIFDKYNLSEFLVSGASSPTEAVSLWENTLGHKELLTGGQYVWGCIYAQNGFGVAIAAY
jgi:uncharacterized protein YkwD